VTIIRGTSLIDAVSKKCCCPLAAVRILLKAKFVDKSLLCRVIDGFASIIRHIKVIYCLNFFFSAAPWEAFARLMSSSSIVTIEESNK